MKRKFNFSKKLGRKNLTLCLVALLLVMMTLVSASYSWIEEVSNVELSSDGDNSPFYVDSTKLDANATMKDNRTAATQVDVDLSKYFYESGGMHLSGCYSDGDTFKFPTNNSGEFRTGTKDDANVNYLSMTFNVTADNTNELGANTAYWFKQLGNNDFITATDSNGTAVSSANIKDYLRASITVDGNTSVYAFNDDGTYNYINTSNAVTNATGRSVRSYMFYDESVSNHKATNPSTAYNWGEGNYDANKKTNLNGNVLFTVNKGSKKTVTLKIWLEYNNGGVQDIRVSNINLGIISSWAKERYIYIIDHTVDEFDRGLNSGRGSGWLSNSNGKLYWALEEDVSKTNAQLAINNIRRQEAVKASWQYTYDSKNYDVYYIKIPTTYNGSRVILYRCNNGWNVGNHGGTSDSDNGRVMYWDKWTTSLPSTFHSEYYAIFSHQFATWSDISDVHDVYYVNSAAFADPATTNKVSGKENLYPTGYLWSSKSITAATGTINNKVVRNADWPGEELTPLNKTKATTLGSGYAFRVFAVYYDSTYDRCIFSDGKGADGNAKGYQSQDLWFTKAQATDLNFEQQGKYFDMATLNWYSESDLPTYTANFLTSNIGQNGDSDWADTNFVFKSGASGLLSGTSGDKEICRVYAKGTSYKFKLRVRNSNGTYTYYGNKGGTLPAGTSWPLGTSNEDNKDITISTTQYKKYKFTLEWKSGAPWIMYEQDDSY